MRRRARCGRGVARRERRWECDAGRGRTAGISQQSMLAGPSVAASAAQRPTVSPLERRTAPAHRCGAVRRPPELHDLARCSQPVARGLACRHASRSDRRGGGERTEGGRMRVVICVCSRVVRGKAQSWVAAGGRRGGMCMHSDGCRSDRVTARSTAPCVTGAAAQGLLPLCPHEPLSARELLLNCLGDGGLRGREVPGHACKCICTHGRPSRVCCRASALGRGGKARREMRCRARGWVIAVGVRAEAD